MKKYDVVAMGELLIDFTENGKSEQGNGLYEANPGGAPCNVLSLLAKMGKETGFIGKVGSDQFGTLLKNTLLDVNISTEGLVVDNQVRTTLAFVHTFPDGDREFSFYRNPGAYDADGRGSESGHDRAGKNLSFRNTVHDTSRCEKSNS